MSLRKAILHGKEHRKPYNDSKEASTACRDLSCVWCLGNKTHPYKKDQESSKFQIKEFKSLNEPTS